jgi:class 3 adenylate cyclase
MRFGRTFIFVDLSGFTNYTESFGDGAAAQLLTQFRGVARAVGSHQGVRIDKYLGDGLMAVAVEALDICARVAAPRSYCLCAAFFAHRHCNRRHHVV